MGKKERKKLMQEEGLHEIENKKRPHARKIKRGGMTLSPKKKRRIVKIGAISASIAVVFTAAFSVNAMFARNIGTIDNLDRQTPWAAPLSGTAPLDYSSKSDAIDNISFLNYRFKQAAKTLSDEDAQKSRASGYKVPDNVYLEVHGTASATVMGINVVQSVNTYKQFNDGMLILADITTSSMVNAARQFCYVGEDVLWRLPAGGKETWATDYDSLVTMQWKDGDPYAHMKLDEFMRRNGLPGTEFTVYLINEETLLDATDVTDNGDGTYSQTYYLDPADDKAPVYYRYQMAFTGNLTDLPEFKSIAVTYTWDSDWRILSSHIVEEYSAPMGVWASCVSVYDSMYEYDTPKAVSNAYDDYFSLHADKPVIDAPDSDEPTALSCLSTAFGSVLGGKSTFNLSLGLGEETVQGKITVDMRDMNRLSIGAQIGNIAVCYDGEKAYLSYGNVKASMSVSELIGLIGELLPAETTDALDPSALDLDTLLGDLAGGEFTLSDDKTHATLSSVLNLMGLSIPVDFSFDVAEKGQITLGEVRAEIAVGGFETTAVLTFGTEEVLPLTQSQKAEYTELVPYVKNLVNLFTSENIRAKIAYRGESFALSGFVDFSLAAGKVSGELSVRAFGGTQTVTFGYSGGEVLLGLGGVKLKVSVQDALKLVAAYLPEDLFAQSGDATFDLAGMLATLLSEEFAQNFTLSESEGVLQIAVKGTELLQAFGVDFALGDVSVCVGESTVTAEAYGATVTLGAAQPFTVSDEGYVEILTYAGYFADLFAGENLTATVGYTYGDLSVTGTLNVNIGALEAQADLLVQYKELQKTVCVGYAQGALYLSLDGVKVKAYAEDIVSLVAGSLEMPETDASQILGTLFALDLDRILSVEEKLDDAELVVTLQGTELLQALGVNFELGEVTLSVSEGRLAAEALGARVEITAGEAFEVQTEGYVDLIAYAGYLIDLLGNENLAASVNYASGDLSVSGSISVNLSALKVAGEFTVTYKDITKQISLAYADGAAYLTLDGLKVSAGIEDAIALISRYLTIPEADGNAEEMLAAVLGLNLSEVIGLQETEGALAIVLQGTELLQALGVNFELGEVTLSVSEGKLAAEALGARVEITAGAAFEVETEGYADLVAYAGYLIDLLGNDNLAASVNYASGDLSVSGSITVNLSALKVAGEFTVTYKDITKNITVSYADGVAYLTLDGLKVSAGIEDAIALISRYLTIPETDGNAEEMLAAVLGLNLSEVIGLQETEGALAIVLQGTELLQALGVNFELGEVTLSVSEGKLAAEALGARVEITAGEAFEVQTEGYADLVAYAGYLIDLLGNDNLAASVNYASGDLSVSGSITVNLSALKVAGEFAVSYKDITKNITVSYADGVAYLTLDGLKVSAGIEDAIALISRYLTIPETDGNAEEMLAAVLGLNLSEIIGLDEKDGALAIVLQGTELLQALGVNFELGEVTLSVSEGKLAAEALGARVEITAGEAFEVQTEGYVDLVAYAGYLIDLLGNDNLAASVNYASGDLSVSGNIALNVAALKVAGEFEISYKEITKNISLAYADGVVYLTLDGLKVSAGIEDAIALISRYLTIPETDGNAEEMLAAVLGLNLSEIIGLDEKDGALAIVLQGTELLQALGVNFELGEVTLSVSEGKLAAEALGARVEITAGEAFEVQTEGYVDLAPVLVKLPDVIDAGGITFGGEFTVTVSGTALRIVIEDGALSWSNGLNCYLDLSVTVGDTILAIQLSATDAGLAFAYGEVGARLEYCDFTTLEQALINLYNRIAVTVNKAAPENRELLPTDETVASLGALVQLFGISLPEGGIDLADLLSSLTLQNTPEGLLAISIKGITAVLADNAEGFLSLNLSYAGEGVTVEGGLNVSALGEGGVPEMPAIPYLGVTEFEQLLDYAGAAVELLAEQNLNLELSGAIYGTDAEGAVQKKYDLAASVNYYAGADFPITIDTQEKTVTVRTDLWLKVDFSLVAAQEGDTSIYLELVLFDENGDGVLDCYASVSQLAKDDAERDPLCVYAPASEIMTLLSQACAVMGVDNSLLTDYVFSKWITLEEAGQLRALGDSVKVMINEILSGNSQLNWQVGAGLVGGNAGSEDSSASTATEAVRRYFISSVAVGANELTLSLDAKALFGGEGTLTLTLGKDDAGKLTAVALASVVNGETRTNLNAGLGYDAQPAPSVSGSYLNLTGLASLVKTLGLSTTHAVDGEVISGEEQAHEYTLNSNFYIDGTIVMDMSALGLMNINVTIKMVAFSINRDENGVIGVNVRFEYDALKKLGITVINGNSTVDLTGKNGMVYIKRTQTTDSDGKGLATPEIVYRAMPLTNFGKDMFNQIGFLFNMSDTIVDMLASIEFSTVDVIGPDFGTTQKNILSSYTYTQSASGDRWLFAINGATLTGGVFGDMNLTLGADAAGNLRTLGLDTAMSMTGLEMTVTADLTYHNPQGVMDSGVKDVTTDIEQLLEDGMCKKLAEMKEKNWQEVVYIEGKYIGIEYVLAGETIATQNVVIGAGNELYGTVSFPDLTPYDTVAGYEPYWDTDYQDGDPIPDSRIFYAKYRARTYGLTFTSEYAIDGWDYDESAGVWVYRTDYVYASGNPLPFAENERRKIVSFLGADGKTYTSLEGWDTLATSFTAVWEYIDYVVTFEIGGETTSQTGHYGDTIVYPEASVDGYTFEGWSATPETITGNLTLSAVLVPNTYTVTLVSEYAAEGFELREDGKYSLVLNYTYGTDLELPTCDNTEIRLHLGGYTDEAGTPVYRVKNILSDVVYTAVWEEIGYAITFVDGNGNTVTTLNGHMGETVSARADLPSVPEKTGYTGEWNFGEDTVTGEMTVSPVYTPNEYTVTIVSSQPYGGFTETDGRYEKYLTYTYDTTLSLETLSDIHGFRFTGYFTQADGAGEEVTEICNILADTVIYACWQDNTVTVTLYSDLKFDGSAYDFNANAYGRTYTFNDVYDLTSDYCPNVTGYQQLGFWHESATGWQQVTNVSSLNGESVWMVWIKNIRVTITQFYTSNMLGGSQYNIGGTVEGGAVFGAHSQEIFTAIGATETTTGVYTLYGATASDDKDELAWGEETTINYDENGVGTFLGEGLNSFTYRDIWPAVKATYGGLVLTKTFSYGSMSITTTYSAIVSLDTYTVTFVDGNGNAVTSSAVRLDCPFDTDDNATYLDSIGPEEFPTGYGKGWENVAVTGNMTVNAYSPNLYGVTFVSDGEVEGWLYCDGGDYAGKWIYETQMYYDSVVNFYGFGDSLLEEYAYTVGLSNVITLPAVPEYGGKSGSWNPAVSATGASFSAVYELDTVVYRSAVGYTVGGGGTIYSSDNPYMAQLIGDYALVTPVAEGYEFLGWWQQSADGSWAKITSVSVSSGDQAVITTVEALWLSKDLSVAFTSATRTKGSWTVSGYKYTYAGSVTISGAVLVGAPATGSNAVPVTYTTIVKYFINDDAATDGQNTILDTNTYSQYVSADSGSGVYTSYSQKSYLNVEVSTTVTLNGIQVGAYTAYANSKVG